MLPTNTYCTSTGDVRIGDRIELHPATDMWMRGARVGEVVEIGKKRVRIRLDALPNRTYRVAPDLIRVVAAQLEMEV